MQHTVTPKQIALEQEMRAAGITRHRKEQTKKKERGQESTTDYGQYLLRVSLPALESAIRESVKACLEGKAGRASTGAIMVSHLEPDVAATITLRVLLNQITTQRGFVHSAVTLGRTLEDEVRIRAYEEGNKRFMTYVLDELDKRPGSYTYKRRRLIQAARKDGQEWKVWTPRERLLVGTFLIDLAIQHTGLITQALTRRGRKETRLILPTANTMKAIKDLNEFKEVLKPEYYPCVQPPRDWTTPFNGGYHTANVRPLTLVKTFNKKYLDELKTVDMPMVYGAVNAMQNTAFKVNTFILDTLKEVWETGIALPKLPPSENLPLPTKPYDISTNKIARREWKKRAAGVHSENNRMNSRRLLLRKTIEIAEQFRDEPTLYMVYQLDFRSRIYSVPSYLNPQGTDYAKGLLTFAKGKPIDEQGACHLAIHGANCFGFDKVNMQDRIDWVTDNEQRILLAAEDPLADLWWAKEASSPFQFLAFCKEWAGWCAEGEGYVSYLPVSADGSCNGLQHFAAMLRCAVTGKEVNLIPSDKPQDIYQKVADRVTEKLKTVEREVFPSQWLQFGVSRKCTKRPCMVLPYGGRQYSFTDFVLDHIKEEAENGKEHPFGEDPFKASAFMANLCWHSIGEVARAAIQAMGWLQKSARLASSEMVPVKWWTPCNFPVLQAYKATKPHRVETKLLGSVFKPSLYSETGELDKHRQANGVAPNFVHSIDASHCMMTIHIAQQLGIHNFAMVHDSFGTHAADAEDMWWCIRKAFVEMYSQTDVLEDFKEDLKATLPVVRHVDIPELPEKGDLDIHLVEESEFFFA